jgi:hypothetical protein
MKILSEDIWRFNKLTQVLSVEPEMARVHKVHERFFLYPDF